jgi:diacylglycerol kinase family enzyme
MYSAVSTFSRRYLINPPRVDVEVGGRTVRGVTLIVQNADPFTYFANRPLHVAEGAGLDTGTLAGVVLSRARPLDLPTVGARLLSQRLRVLGHRRVVGFTAETALRMRSADGRPIPIQVDGDYIGDADEAVFGISPGGLTVVS